MKLYVVRNTMACQTNSMPESDVASLMRPAYASRFGQIWDHSQETTPDSFSLTSVGAKTSGHSASIRLASTTNSTAVINHIICATNSSFELFTMQLATSSRPPNRKQIAAAPSQSNSCAEFVVPLYSSFPSRFDREDLSMDDSKPFSLGSFAFGLSVPSLSPSETPTPVWRPCRHSRHRSFRERPSLARL